MSMLRFTPGRTEVPLLVDYRSAEGARVTAVRGTLIASSLATLRELDHLDRYVERVSVIHRDAIFGARGAEWLPVAVADAHYATCDSLALSAVQLEGIGQRVSRRLLDAFLVSQFRPEEGTEGATPWLPLAHYGRLFTGLLRGGTCTVEGIGPRDAVIRANGASFFATDYFRNAYHAVLRGAVAMFAGDVAGRTTSARETGPNAVVTTLSWA